MQKGQGRGSIGRCAIVVAPSGILYGRGRAEDLGGGSGQRQRRRMPIPAAIVQNERCGIEWSAMSAPSTLHFILLELFQFSLFYTLSIRCTTRAVAAPPPLHIAATPYSPTCNWCSSVVRIREPELPRACPRDMAPPRRFTFAFSRPRICLRVSHT